MLYIGQVKPFVSGFQNNLELSNETLVLVNTYFMIIYSDFVPDPYIRSQMGLVNICILGLMILVNLCLIIK